MQKSIGNFKLGALPKTVEAVMNGNWDDTGRFIVDIDKNVGQIIIKMNKT